MNIKVGCSKYKVKKISTKEFIDRYGEAGSEVYGYLDDVNGDIGINSEMCPQQKCITFWHEVTHALLEELGKSELSGDEDFVDSFGRQLYAFHQNNDVKKVHSYVVG